MVALGLVLQSGFHSALIHSTALLDLFPIVFTQRVNVSKGNTLVTNLTSVP